MKAMCAWCGAELPGSQTTDGAEFLVSHGICVDCRRKFFGDPSLRQLDLFLDSLDVPVLASDGDAVMSYANNAARTLLDKRLPDIKGFRGGDVFECVNARLPGGCGHTEQCPGCELRRTVTETFRTGQGLKNVPVTLTRIADGRRSKVRARISTEKAGDIVLLRIDALGPAD